MNFAIEVPAESNPLTPETLFQVLRSASSNDQQQVQTGTKQLQNWEKCPGFHSSLQSLYIVTSLPLELRYLSIIQLKNGIDKYWRKAAANAIKKDEKEIIKSRSVESTLTEGDVRLALQASIIIGKVVRSEYPHDWPDAISSVVERLQSANEASNILHSSRLLLILLYIVKELSTARLRSSQASLQAAAPNITRVLSLVYLGSAQKWMTFLQFGGEDEGGALDCMDQSLLALRVLRRLIMVYDSPHRQNAIQELWNTLTVHFGRMLTIISDPDQPLELQAGPKYLIEKHLLQIAKLHLNMSKIHPAAFALLPGSLDLVHSYWRLVTQFGQSYGKPTSLTTKIGSDGDADEEDEAPFQEKVSLIGLLLLRACSKMIFNPAQTFKYQQVEDKEEKNKTRAMVKDQLLTPEFARQIMETLVTRFFIFTPRDLKQWEEEPDEWEKSQEDAGDDWEFSIRTCSEKLFLDLVINYKDVLVPQLLNIISTASSLDYDDIFFKDSIYAAVGLAAPVLDQKFDFANFLNSTLVQEIQVQNPSYRILRRRISIVLGQWLPVREGLNRTLVYQIFQHLLDNNDRLNDQVVRVTAGRQLHNVIDPFEFTAEGFMPFAPPILSSMIALIQEVELPETKLALLRTLSLIVIKMEDKIAPFTDQIISLLPPLWEQAGEEYLLKQSILGILSALVTSMQTDSQKYHPLIIPLIESSVEPTSETRPYLLEDALDLWSAILEQTPTPASPETIKLVQHLIPMFEVASDTLRKALDITEAYIYLIPSEILSDASVFLTPFTSLLGSLKREANGAVSHLVELLIRSANMIGGVEAVEALTSTMLSTNFLQTLLNGLHTSYHAHQTTGPNKVLPPIDGVIETDYLSILARLAVSSPALFTSAIEAATSTPSTIDWLLTEWLAHMDSIAHPLQRKLSCLALTSLVATAQPWILSRLQQLMSIWTDVITELVVDDDDENGNPIKRDTLVYTPTTFAPTTSPHPNPFTLRTQTLALADPVHAIDIRDHVRENLGTAVAACGGLDVFRERWIGDVDRDVLGGFGALGVF